MFNLGAIVMATRVRIELSLFMPLVVLMNRFKVIFLWRENLLILNLMILDFKFRIASIHNLRFKTYNYGIFLNNVYRPNASTINNKAPIKAK